MKKFVLNLSLSLFVVHYSVNAQKETLWVPDKTFQSTVGFSSGPRTTATCAVIDMVQQPDAKIVAAGIFTSYNNVPCNNIVRLNADGSFDNNFNTGTGFNKEVSALALQSDGRILVAGKFDSLNGQRAINIVRLNADGSQDMSFNYTEPYSSFGIGSVIIEPGGTILVNGGIRLRPDGSEDNTFLHVRYLGTPPSAAVQPDGKIIRVGEGRQGDNLAVHRLNVDGSLDSTFGIQSKFNVLNYGVYGGGLFVHPNGKILVAGGFSGYDDIPSWHLAWFNEDGSHYSDYAGLGNQADFTTVALQPDGKILMALGGRSVIRRTATGGYDSTLRIDNFTQTDLIYKILVQSDGKLVMGGDFKNMNGNRIIRYEKPTATPPPPPTDIASINSNISFDVSPNPATGSFFVRLAQAHAEPVTITISNVAGSVLQSFPAKTEITRVGLEGYPSGIYFVRLSHMEDTMVKKLVVY